MHLQVVHEQSEFSLVVQMVKLAKINFKIILVNGTAFYLDVLNSFFLGHRSYRCEITCVDSILIDCYVCVSVTERFEQQCLLREGNFVQVNDLTVLLLCLLHI